MPVVPVPQYQQQVQAQPLPNARVQTDVDPEAFGNGRSSEKLFKAAQDAGQQLADHFQKEQDKADQVAHVAADAQLSQAETEIQIETKKMQGKDALAAPDYASEAWEKKRDEIRDSLTNDNQRRAFDMAATQRWSSVNKHVQFHVADQVEKYDDQETTASIQTSRQAAVLNAGNSERVNEEVMRQSVTLQDWAARKGIDSQSETYKQKMNEVISGTHKDVIQARIDQGSPVSAAQYFKENKKYMSAQDIISTEKAVDTAQTLSQGTALWGTMKTYTLPDGNPDEGRMIEEINKRSDMSLEKKEQVKQVVLAKAAEYKKIKTQNEAAEDRGFQNAIIGLRKAGQPVEDAMKVAMKNSRDNLDQQAKVAAVKEVFGPPKDSDPGTFINLWEKAKSGETTRQDIDTAMTTGRINAADWKTLREAYYNSQQSGRDPLEKAGWERVRALVDEKIPDKVQKEKFMYQMHVKGKDKSPEEVWKIANDQLDKAPGTGWWGTNFFAKTQYEDNLPKMDAVNFATGKLHQDLGRDVVDSILAGAARTKRGAGPADVEILAQQYGGYDQIKRGTPVNNAIQKLGELGLPATKPNIDKALDLMKAGRLK